MSDFLVCVFHFVVDFMLGFGGLRWELQQTKHMFYPT